MPQDRFYVKAPSVNAVRRALGRAPGGVRVIGRFDRETIECAHTMEPHSLARHWPVVLDRLTRAGLTVVARPGGQAPAWQWLPGLDSDTATDPANPCTDEP